MLKVILTRISIMLEVIFMPSFHGISQWMLFFHTILHTASGNLNISMPVMCSFHVKPWVLLTVFKTFAKNSTCIHGSRLGYETNGLSRSALQRALIVVILLTSIRGIKNFTKRKALGGVNCNYLHQWIFGLPLNLKQFWINLIFIPPIFDCKRINWYQYENYKTYRFTPYR